PAGSTVTWQGTLLTSVDNAVYAVVNHPVTVDGADTATDAGGQVLLGPADGVDGANPSLGDDGVRVAFGSSLPAGDYALVVDVVAAGDRRFAYGSSVAVFFTVPAPGQPAPAPTVGAPPPVVPAPS